MQNDNLTKKGLGMVVQSTKDMHNHSRFYLLQTKRGYYQLHEYYYNSTGKRQHRCVRYLGKDLTNYESFMADARGLAAILQTEPHLLLDVNLKRLVSEAKRQKEVVNLINQLPERQPVLELQQKLAQAQAVLEEKQQPLLQEILRLEGEVRLLQRLSKDGGKAKPE